MLRAYLLLAVLIPSVAFAQSASPGGDSSGDMGAAVDDPDTMQNMIMQMMQPGAQGTDPKAMHQMMMSQSGGQPVETGQSAFAAIQEIVALLAADPKTDWSKVNIEALRQHLIDMNNVTLQSRVEATPQSDGILFKVTGDGPVADSIRRMVMAHAATMNGANGWKLAAADIAGGASLRVIAPQSDIAKLQGLGFIGILTLGMHHQMHHLMIAKGLNPHG